MRLSLLLATVVLLALPTAARAEFCWRDSYGRGAGTLPNACPTGQQYDAGLCYPNCKAGYTGVGPVCWQSCPSGYPDFGVGCSKPASYGRGGGYTWWASDGISDSGMFNRCQSANGGAGTCEKIGAIVYPKCKPGFHQVGCCVCSPDCPSGLIDSGATCTKNSYGRGAGTLPTCASGLQYDAGLCYQPAKAGYTGVGPVAWGNCPATSPVNCGAGCAATDAECAEAIQGQVLSVLEMVGTVVGSVFTGGAGTAIKAGLQAGIKTTVKNFAAKLTKDQIRKQIKSQAQSMAESQVESLVAAAAGEEFDPTSLDPSGIAAIVQAYNHKVCQAPAAISTPPPPVVTKTQPVLPGKIYRLTNKKSGLIFIEMSHPTISGVYWCEQYTDHQDKSQRWWFLDAGNGYFRFINGRYIIPLDVKDGSIAEGAELYIDPQSASIQRDSQLWSLETTGDGYFLIINKKSGKAAAVVGASMEEKARIVQLTKSNEDHFKWRFDENAGQ
ncbi:Arabinogalactan endo-1,4-beta-galactosidase [Archangium gephyra]|nr:Arabinogalactan endo-1,4-beta-galactosidase [Archangium gephyra]